jgi:D-alanine--poly(phosphoribitol) ligase subunit 1
MVDRSKLNQNDLELRFRDVVSTNPQGKILSMGDSYLSYHLLCDEADQIANEFKSKLGSAKRHIVIDSQKEPASLAIIVACWFLKWSYTFVDSRQPIERLQQILKASNASVFISYGIVNKFDLGVCIEMQTLNRLNFTLAAEQYRSYAFGHDTCYIMFTSGSTGSPKGVPITSSQVLQFANWLKLEFGIKDSDILTSVNPWYFDNSVFDIYLSLLSGSSLVLVDIDKSQGSLDWIESLMNKNPTVWFSVPSLLVLLQSVGAFMGGRFTSLRLIIFGGEAYPKNLLKQLVVDQGTETEYRSVYGPTETTCICSVTVINEAELNSGTSFVSLGEFPNFIDSGLYETFTLENGEIAGELMLGGSSVTEGYVNQSDNLGKFALIPRSDGNSSRYYLTGDLVSYNQELKRLCFLGRKDNQIKRSGVRIELEEIEARLERENRTNCLADFDPSRALDLCVLFEVNDLIDEKELVISANLILPSYMIPRAVFGIEKLPLNANGKKDRKGAKTIISGLLEVNR